MHGAVHDYIVLKTVKGGKNYQTGETHDRFKVSQVTPFKFKDLKEQPQFDRLLDIGSLDLIGSMRGYNFMGTEKLWTDIVGIREYVGIDIMPGKSVDIVMNAHNLGFPDNSFDIVLCLQMLEHDDNAPQTIKEAYRVLKEGQPFILTCASAEHPEHADLGGGSSAYIHIEQEELEKWFAEAGFDLTQVEITKEGSNFYVYAVKSTSPAKSEEQQEESTELKPVKKEDKKVPDKQEKEPVKGDLENAEVTNVKTEEAAKKE